MAQANRAPVAESVDAMDSKSISRKGVPVRTRARGTIIALTARTAHSRSLRLRVRVRAALRRDSPCSTALRAEVIPARLGFPPETVTGVRRLRRARAGPSRARISRERKNHAPRLCEPKCFQLAKVCLLRPRRGPARSTPACRVSTFLRRARAGPSKARISRERIYPARGVRQHSHSVVTRGEKRGAVDCTCPSACVTHGLYRDRRHRGPDNVRAGVGRSQRICGFRRLYGTYLLQPWRA